MIVVAIMSTLVAISVPASTPQFNCASQESDRMISGQVQWNLSYQFFFSKNARVRPAFVP
ncbi:MAG: hypothetical protein IT367_16325 [Candidatus Hydrogenedentes bacterium]|nr:hypothetical protein [Candidatus Hydrogenedentota bacterium]